jgi:hypothetical protein
VADPPDDPPRDHEKNDDITFEAFPGLARRAIAHGIATALVAAFGTGSAYAFQFDTANPDLSVRWDNTFRYNYAVRVEERDQKIGNSPIADEGTYSFDKGDAVANRLDILSELDVIYKNKYGMRFSAAGWYDGAYGDKSHGNPNLPFRNIPSYVGNEYSNFVKRYYGGPSGELLDAFLFGTFDIGSVPVSVKVGRHSLYWGESLLLGGNLHSVAYAQNPLDLQKGFATPGVEVKELFRPLTQLSAQAQVTDTLSFAGQYLLEWDNFQYPEGGTYLGPVDFAFNGPDRQFVSAGLGFAYRGPPSEPSEHGEWGLNSRWSPEWLDGTLGFYYRNFRRQAAADLHHQGRPAERLALQPDLRRRHRPVRDQSCQERRPGQPRRRVLVPPQHPAQQPGAGHRARAAG